MCVKTCFGPIMWCSKISVYLQKLLDSGRSKGSVDFIMTFVYFFTETLFGTLNSAPKTDRATPRVLDASTAARGTVSSSNYERNVVPARDGTVEGTRRRGFFVPHSSRRTTVRSRLPRYTARRPSLGVGGEAPETATMTGGGGGGDAAAAAKQYAHTRVRTHGRCSTCVYRVSECACVCCVWARRYTRRRRPFANCHSVIPHRPSDVHAFGRRPYRPG